MKKHLLQNLLLIAALLVPWSTQAQMLSDYTFSTGVDATKWITLTSPTTIFSTGVDDNASSLYNIGFSFPFGDDSYTQFSVSSNGIFKLGSPAASSSTTAGQFNSSNYTTSLPKICGVAKDIGTAGTGYVRYQLTGTAPNRVLVCEYLMGYTYSATTSDVAWQVQLHEDSSRVVIVYGSSAPATNPSSYQTGLATAGNDIVILNPSTHAALYQTTYYATTYSTWHGVNRYYSFVRPVITCPAPQNLISTALTTTSATISWTAGGTETTWQVARNATSIEDTVTTTSYTFTGLTPNTEYTFRVRAVCGTDDASSWRTITVRTPCAAFSLPYTQNFDAASTGSSTTTTFVNCMTRLNNGTQYFGYPYVGSSTYNHTPGGSKGLYWYNSTTTGTYGDYQCVVLPAIDTTDIPVSGMKFSFWAKASSTSYSPVFYVGVMTDPNNISTFQQVSTVNVGNSAAWQLYEVNLSDYTGNGIYVALRANRGSSSWYAYVDDISLTQAPDCPHVNSLAVSNITTTTADLSWTETGSATSWKVKYYPNSTPASVDSVIATATSVTLTGLSVNTGYTVVVAPVCTIGNGVYEETTTTFITECYPIDTLPYSYGFEGLTTGTSTARPVIPCWHHLNNGTQYFGYPYPSSTAHTGTRSLYWYMTTTTGTYADYEVVVLPGVSDSIDLTNTQLRFWAKASSASYRPIFEVGVMSDPYDVSTFTLVETHQVNPTASSTDWEELYTSFENYAGTGRYVAVRALRPTSSWYAYTDDFVLEVLPDCRRVEDLHASGITDVTADISWVEMGSAYLYEVIYGPTATPSQTDTLIASDTTITLTGLTGTTTYRVIVSPICAEGAASPNQITFTTRCAALATLPYTMGFETSDGVTSTGSSTSNTWVNCWGRLNNATQYFGYPYVSSSTTYNHTPGGTKGLYWYNNTTTGTYGDYQCIIMPAVDTDIYPVNTLRLKFWAKSSSTSYYPVFQVGVMTDPDDINTFQLVHTINVGGNTNWEEYITSFTEIPDTLYGRYIAVRALRPTNYWYAYVDDFTLEEVPACPAITDLEVESTGTTGAFITWNYEVGSIGSPHEFEIEWYEEGSTGTPSSLTDTVMQAFISGLDTNTTYWVRVRANCWDEGYGAWDSISFTTATLGCAVPDPALTDTILFANGTSTGTGTLVYSGYGNTVCQNIYTAAELLAAGLTPGPISGIDLGFATNSSYAKELTIFIANTTKTSFSSSTDMVNPAQMQQVYGPAAHPLNTSGWQHYDFTEPFVWDGVSNIVVCNFMNQPSGVSHSSSGFSGYYTTGPSASMAYRYQDSNPYNTSNYTGGSSGSTSANRASIHFYTFGCLVEATCAAPMVRMTRVEAYEADIEWTAGLDETAWDVDYREVGTSAWTNLATAYTSTSYTLFNLNPATNYEVRVSHYCATDDTIYAGTVTFLTPCAPYNIPFTENFDSYVASSSSQLGPCWNKYYNSGTHVTTSYPYPSSSYHHSGSNSLYFYGYDDTYCNWLVLPQMADSIHTLELSFWEYKTSSTYGLVEVGVIVDPMDLTTFTPVDTVQVQNTSSWQQFFVNFTNYTGPEGRIAMVGRTSSSYSFYIDDIEVGRYSTCPRVTGLAATRLTNDSAYVSWMGDSAAAGFRVWWSTTDNLPAATDSIDLVDPNLALGWLGPNATIYMWVSQFCDDGAMSSPVRVVFTTAANCEVITDLHISHVTASTAAFTWNSPQAGYPAISYVVRWQTATGATMMDTTPNTFYLLTGLDSVTTYNFSVQSICSHSGEDDSSFWVNYTFTTHDSRCNRILGNGTSTTTSIFPLYTSYPYSFGHMLFYAEELESMGDTISGISLNVTSGGGITRNVDVYIGNSDVESMFAAGASLRFSDLTQVFSGNWAVTSGTNTITFDTFFVRDHSRNLVVLVDDNTGTTASSVSFSAYTTLNAITGDAIYTVHYAYASANPDPATAPLMYLTNGRPVVTFLTTCAPEGCTTPLLVASNPTDTTITAYWNASSGTSWNVEYRLPTDTVWTVAANGVTTPQYTIGGLIPSTRYQVRVSTVCSATQSFASVIYASTACGDLPVPFFDDFNDIYNGYFERPCWRVGNADGQARGEYTYPYVRNYTQYGPMFRLARGGYAVMPHFAEPLSSLQVRFVYRSPLETSYEIFGYLTDPDDINTLVVIDTLWPNPGGEGLRLYTIDLDQLADDADGNLCFYVPHNLNDNNLIDDLVVDLIPPCAIPDSLRLVSAIDTSADLTWYMSNIGSATYMVRYSVYRSGVYDTVYTSGTSVTLNGLIPGTTYDVECFSICLRTGDTSLASNVCRFTTDCAPLPTLPYVQTFENIPLSSTQTLPNCWEIAATNTTSPSGWPQCVFEAANAASGYYYVLIQSETALAMPEFVAPPDSLQISFYMKTASVGDMVEVGVIDTMVPLAYTAIDTFTTTGTSYEFFSAYMVGYTGPGTRIYIRTLNNNAVYIDNLVIDYAPTCLPVRNLHVSATSSSSITLAWRDLTSASQYEVEYGNAGFDRGTGTFTTVTTNPAHFLGLTPMTNYDFYVRPICSVGDSAEWSPVLHASTAMCDNLVTADSWDSAWSATTNNYSPIGYSFYNYTYVQTIIDAARFAEVEAEITAFAFNPAASTAGDEFNHMDVYMANVSESDLSNGFIMPDANHQFVQVLHDADLTYSTVGWQMHSFDTAFVWDGHSNVLFAVNRRHGHYTSGASFNAHSTSVAKSRYVYTDSSPYDINTVTGGTTQNYVGDLQFFSCAAACDRPDIASVTGDYQSATLNWVGNGTAYEVAYRTSADTNWTAPVAVTGSTYTFTGLQPLTMYELRVRQDCSADSLGFSAWNATLFRTDTMPCHAPDTFGVIGTTNATATFAWLPSGDETAWEIHVFSTTFDSLYTVTTIPGTVGGFTAGATYYASIRALCGDA
ncbi:MAG: fibronectin type III domain-containing protein, partial [Bacteroidales bacterium]|nr:fibronectin type III domain-containing protein [Bacteroidales bacterium]